MDVVEFHGIFYVTIWMLMGFYWNLLNFVDSQGIPGNCDVTLWILMEFADFLWNFMDPDGI